MKNIYFNTIKNNAHYLLILIALLVGNVFTIDAQVKKTLTQRTSSYTPTKKIYNIKGDFTMLGNTNLTPQNYSPTTNNNGSTMQYVDIDGDSNTFNSSSSTLDLSTENGALPSCSKIIYAGLYWTGKSSANSTFTVNKTVPSSPHNIDNNYFVSHNNNITNSNYSLSISRGGSKNSRFPIYEFTDGNDTYFFSYTNTSGSSNVTLSINGTSVNIPVTIITVGSTATATFTTPYIINDGTVNVTIKQLIRDTSINDGDYQGSPNAASVNVSGTISTAIVTKTFDKRKISLKGPQSSSYTEFSAGANDIYYPSGTDDNIYSAYVEVTDYVKTNGVGAYFAADIALLEGNPGGTGYSGGWGMIVVYENSKMKYRDVTIFDGYAYVQASNTSGFTLPVTGFNTIQSGTVNMKLGLMASEGDVDFTGDYFQIQKVSDASYMDLSHSGNDTANFFNSSILAGGTRNPSLVNNTGIDISMFNVLNTNNTVITNNQSATNFKYGTSGDTYSIFAIAMAVDAYTPVVDAVIAAKSVNNVPVSGSITSVLPGDIIEAKINIYNKGTEAVNSTKYIIAIPYTLDYVGSLTNHVNFSPLPSPNNYYFDPLLGPKGSIVFDLGTLPLPADPNTILADFSFKVKVTEDCAILTNSICNQNVEISGFISGTGATTGINFSNKPLYVGYNSTGTCTDEPILNPLSFSLNSAAYVAAHCQDTPNVREFVFCTPDPTISVDKINSGFPLGYLFYNQFPVTNDTEQYDISNPFPATLGSVNYYAVPPGASGSCNFPFTIKVTNVTTMPETATSIEYCQGATALPLTATVSNPAYTLYYFTSLTGGIAQTSLEPSTTTAGSTTYYVAEAASSSCIGPRKAIVVTVNAKPAEPVHENCWDTYSFTDCAWVNNNTPKPTEPVHENCWDTYSFTDCAWVNNNTPKPTEPVHENCWDTYSFNTTTCVWDVTGTQPVKPALANYETATWNPETCIWDITGNPPIIIAQDDTIAGGNGTTGNTNVGNVLNNNGNGNDTLNDVNVTLDQVNLTITTPATPIGGAPVPVISTTTGQISVPIGTPAGTYTLTYSICDKLNPTNCDSATVTITVTALAIVAKDDKFIDLDGANGNSNAGNVLNNNGNGNDTLNGINVTIDLVNLTVTIPAVSIGGAPVPVIDTTTGQVNVPVGTPAGTYTIVYSICEKSNSTNCDSATVILEVAVVFGVGCDAIIVHKALTPNFDDINDILIIDGVEDSTCYPSGVNIEIYNRWGVLVFETSKYSNTSNYFDGYSRGRTTVSKSDGLPTGTYFYILNYESVETGNIQMNKKDGFIYLSR